MMRDLGPVCFHLKLSLKISLLKKSILKKTITMGPLKDR